MNVIDDIIQKTEDKLLEITLELDKLIGLMPGLLTDTCMEEEYYEEVTKVLKVQCEHFKRLHEAGFECAGLISYYDFGLEWLEQVRLLEFTSHFGNGTKDIHDCVMKIISLDIEITKLMHF